MIDLGLLLTTGSEALSLVSQLREILDREEEVRGDNKSLLTIFPKMRLEAIRMSAEFSGRLRQMLSEFDELDVDLDRTIHELIDDTSWYNFITRSKLKNLQDRFHDMYRELSGFIDDMTAILICSGRIPNARGAFHAAAERKQQLDGLLFEKASVRRVLDRMIEIADQLSLELQRESVEKAEAAGINVGV